MNTDSKNKSKKNIATAASTVAGAAAGVGITAAFTPSEAKAAEPAAEQEHTGAASGHTPHDAQSTQVAQHTPAVEETHTGDDTIIEATVSQNPGGGQSPTVSEPDEAEVLGFERVNLEDGSVMDVAMVHSEGAEILVFDVDLDGQADVVLSDANGNGEIEDDEVIDVGGQGISMEPLREAAEFTPVYARTDTDIDIDTPDYVDDADVDTFMA